MAYFDENFNRFFRGLEKNNDKTWFDKNKANYEKSVKLPFEHLVADLILKMQKLHPGFHCDVKSAVFRIYRDIRFSADKTPYKTHVSAAIVHGGKKNFVDPGLYFEMGAKGIGIYGGVYMPEKEQLYNIRAYIASHAAEVKKLKADKKFNSVYGGIQGEVNKVIPGEFKEAFAAEPLIAHKQFYFMARFDDPKLVTSDKLLDFIMDKYKIGLPWANFFSNALKQ